MGIEAILWLFLSGSQDGLICKDAPPFYDLKISSTILQQTAKKVFDELLESREIEISFHKGLAPLWNELHFDQSDPEELKSVSGNHLLFGISLNGNSEISGYRLIREDCLWTIAKKQMSTEEAEWLQNARIYELPNLKALAIVPNQLRPQSILTIPLGDPEGDLKTTDFLYIKNGDRFQKQLFKMLFGDSPFFFSSVAPIMNQSEIRFLIYLEELHHLLDFHLRSPELSSEIYADLDYRERPDLAPKDYYLRRSYEEFRNSEFYQNLVDQKISEEKKNLPFPSMYPELTPIWRKQMTSRLEIEYWKQMKLLTAYLTKHHEALAKWQVIQTLKNFEFNEDEVVQSMSQSIFEHAFVSEPIAGYFKDLFQRKRAPESRAHLIMKALDKYLWSDSFRQVVARLAMSEPKIAAFDKKLEIIEQKRLWELSPQEQLFQVWLIFQPENSKQQKYQRNPPRLDSPYFDSKLHH